MDSVQTETDSVQTGTDIGLTAWGWTVERGGGQTKEPIEKYERLTMN